MNPVLCGSSYRNKGVQPMLDAVVDYLPSPLDVPSIKGTLKSTGAEIERHGEGGDPGAVVFDACSAAKAAAPCPACFPVTPAGRSPGGAPALMAPQDQVQQQSPAVYRPGTDVAQL